MELASPYASFDCFYTSRRRSLKVSTIILQEIRVSQNLAKLGGGCTTGRSLVASQFAYEAFRRSTSSSLKPKTKPFDGLRTVYSPPSLFTLLLKANIFFSLEFARLSSRGATNLLTSLREKQDSATIN